MDNRNSLLQQHLRILELGGRSPIDGDASEAERIRGAQLPNLPRQKSYLFETILRLLHLQVTLPMAAAGALVALVVFYPSHEHVRFKGNYSVSFVVKRDGKTTPWNMVDSLQSGDQFMVKIHAHAAGYFYLAFVDHDGVLLSTTEEVVSSELQIAAGNDGFFAGAFGLTEPSSGESAVVAFCHSSLEGLETDQLRDILGISSDSGTCKSRIYELR